MSAYRLPRHPEAFSNAPAKGKKRPREHNRNHLEWIRTLPCLITGERPVDAAHVRYADQVYGKPLTGKGEKPDDKWAVPLSRKRHDEQHSMSERAFWEKYGIDPLQVALALHAVSGDDDQAFVILRATKRLFAAQETE